MARRVLARVAEGAYATLALDGELRRAGLADADRALATELVYGVLRWRLRLDRALEAMTPRGLSCDARTLDALRLGAYQLLRTRVPPHAAVDDAVEAARRLRGAGQAGFVNALLRRLARAGEPTPTTLDKDERRAWEHSTPPWIIAEVRAALGPEESTDEDALARTLSAFNEAAPVWLRANALRTHRDALASALQAERPRAELRPSALAPEALAVVRGGELFSTQASARGEFVAQDLGAQLVTLLLDPRPGDLLLDACAGVGGKSTHLAELTQNHATIDAADLSARKLALGRDTAHRLGAAIHTLAADLCDPAAPLRPAYDRVLLDAPCSGLGVLRRHPELKWRRTTDDVRVLAALQARLLAALAPRVRPGGLLVYSVCTFTAAEGPEQVRAFLAAHPEFRLEPAPTDGERFHAWAELRAPDGALRTWPHRDGADAFYAARLRRVG